MAYETNFGSDAPESLVVDGNGSEDDEVGHKGLHDHAVEHHEHLNAASASPRVQQRDELPAEP
jgi:hypothetical protein